METDLKHPAQYDFVNKGSDYRIWPRLLPTPQDLRLSERLKIDSVPLLQVNTEGFSAVEDGDLTQRVLLSDVSSEAAHAFLNYLYTADIDISPSLAPDLRSLALRWDGTVHTLHSR